MSTGHIIAAAGKLTLGTARAMLTDIPSERFARLPVGEVGAVPTNHPAWVYGHLGLYGARLAASLGRAELSEAIAAPEGWDDLFGPRSTCDDDPDGQTYPPMKKVVAQFETSFPAMLDAIDQADEAVFEKANPNAASRDRFPTIGVQAAFLATGHPMLHLGQVSVWRRVEGLGSALGF